MRDWIQKRIPTEESLKSKPGLRWLGPLLRRRWLWHLNRRTVSIGVGVGVFFGFLIPIMQIAGAAIFAVVLRANLPVAAVSTLVSNPFTYVPIGLMAYKTGMALMGEALDPQALEALSSGSGGTAAAPVETSWADTIAEVGKPLFLGLAVFAVVGGLSSGLLVYLIWTIAARSRRRRRLLEFRDRMNRT